MDCEVVRNSFAIECFRNVADEDYIAARSAYRMGFMNHFLWSALQAIEKYLKSFLLINGQSTIELSHDIEKAYFKASSVTRIGFQLPPEELFLLRHINSYGANRYLEHPSFTRGNELPALDLLVWMTRRYCQPLDTTLKMLDGEKKDMLSLNLQMICNPMYIAKPHKFKLIGGTLEKIIGSGKTDRRRQVLVWGNRYYGPGKALRLRRSHMVNPPLSRYPDERQCLQGLVKLPKASKQPERALIVGGRRIVPGSFQVEQTPFKR